MKTFTVHEPPESPIDRLDRAEALVLVREGMSWGALLFGPLWMIACSLWWPLVGYLIMVGAIELAVGQLGLDQRIGMAAVLGLGLIVALEADTLQRWSLRRAGWREVGSVVGRDREECERRFIEAWLPKQPVLALPGVPDRAELPPMTAIAGPAAPTAGQPRSRGWRSWLGGKPKPAPPGPIITAATSPP